MKRLCGLLVLVGAPIFAGVSVGPSAATQEKPLRVIAFGAHPDDAELKVGGDGGALGRAGAQGEARRADQRRRRPLRAGRRSAGAAPEGRSRGPPQDARRRDRRPRHPRRRVDADLETRKKVAGLIREWQADIVLSHRPWDYHPDHRAVGKLAEDAAVVVAAPFFAPYTPPTNANPIFLFYSDGFQKPYPFDPIIAVGFDEVAEKKWDCIGDMPSQFADADSWQGRTLAERAEGRQGTRRLSARDREEAEPGRCRTSIASGWWRCTVRSAARRSSTPRRFSSGSTGARRRSTS